MSTPNRPEEDARTRPAQGMSSDFGTVPCHDAMALTQGGSVAQISLNGQNYALRITRQGKLILTK